MPTQYPNSYAQDNSYTQEHPQYVGENNYIPYNAKRACFTTALAAGVSTATITGLVMPLMGGGISLFGLAPLTSGLALGGIVAGATLLLLPIIGLIGSRIKSWIGRKRAARKAKQQTRMEFLKQSGAIKNEEKAGSFLGKLKQAFKNHQFKKNYKMFNFAWVNCGLLGGDPKEKTLVMLSTQPVYDKRTGKTSYIAISPYIHDKYNAENYRIDPEALKTPGAVQYVTSNDEVRDYMSQGPAAYIQPAEGQNGVQQVDPIKTTSSGTNNEPNDVKEMNPVDTTKPAEEQTAKADDTAKASSDTKEETTKKTEETTKTTINTINNITNTTKTKTKTKKRRKTRKVAAKKPAKKVVRRRRRSSPDKSRVAIKIYNEKTGRYRTLKVPEGYSAVTDGDKKIIMVRTSDLGQFQLPEGWSMVHSNQNICLGAPQNVAKTEASAVIEQMKKQTEVIKKFEQQEAKKIKTLNKAAKKLDKSSKKLEEKSEKFIKKNGKILAAGKKQEPKAKVADPKKAKSLGA